LVEEREELMRGGDGKTVEAKESVIAADVDKPAGPFATAAPAAKIADGREFKALVMASIIRWESG
jgi:hypothetical protein